MQENGCNRIVFSSSASVYGNPEYLPIDEKHPVRLLISRERISAFLVLLHFILRSGSMGFSPEFLLQITFPVPAGGRVRPSLRYDQVRD